MSGPPARPASTAGLPPTWQTVAALGTAQTLAWASSYYLAAILAEPMAREWGISRALAYGGLSLALVVSAAVGPLAGRVIDRWGGRPLLMGTSGLFALGLAVLASAPNLLAMGLGWLLIGLAMGAGLYEAAFATLVRWYGQSARAPITGITLIAGFASTVGWPLSAWMEWHWGWRGACWGWALLHLLVGLPLNAGLPRAPTLTAPPAQGSVADRHGGDHAPAADTPRTAALAVLALVFAIGWFTSTAMAAHLPQLLMDSGMGLAAAVAVGALVGPAQVAGRLLEYGVLRHVHPLLSARLATVTHPLAALALLVAGPVAAVPFALLHGAGNGVLTIAKGTLPLALFGESGYGARQGWLMLPARLAQAAAPVVFGACLQAWGVQSLWLSAGLGLLATAALLSLRTGAAAATGPRRSRR